MSLVKFYQDLVAQQQLKKEKGWEFKIRNYRKAISAIQDYEALGEKCTTMDNVKAAFTAAGMKNPKGLLEKAEMAFAGESCKDEKTIAMEQLCTVPWVGPEKAKTLMSMGINSIQELRSAFSKNTNILTHAQSLGLKYYDDLFDQHGNEKRIPRSEIEPFDKLLKKALKDDYAITGSFRRNKPDCGDVDVLTRRKCVKNLIAKLQEIGFQMDTLAEGPNKYMGFIRLKKNGPMRRLDILYVPPEEYAFAINYFTGSKEHNVKMRAKALQLGYTFNEHRILYTDGSPVPEQVFVDKIGKSRITEERDLFDFLDYPWKQPWER